MKNSLFCPRASFVIIFLFSSSAVFSQTEMNRWNLGIGLNIVDIRAPNHRTQTEDFNSVLEDYVKFVDDANSNLGALRLVASRSLSKEWAVQVATSFNTIKKDFYYYTTGTEKKQSFFAVDAKVTYNLDKLVGAANWFDPYVLVGGGYTKQGDRSGLMYAFGGGVKVWTSDTVGIAFQSDYNGNGAGKELSYFQHSIALVFTLTTKSNASWTSAKESNAPKVE